MKLKKESQLLLRAARRRECFRIMDFQSNYTVFCHNEKYADLLTLKTKRLRSRLNTTQDGMDLLRRIMPPLAQPLIDYFNLAFQSVSGVVTTETEHDDQHHRPASGTFTTSPWTTTQTALTTLQKRGTGALRHCSVRTIRPSGHASSYCRRQMLPSSQHPPETGKWNYGTLRRRRRRLHGLCMEYDNERRPLEYKLLSLTYNVFTTSQPSYLNNLISVQPPRGTRSSSVVTLSRPPTISSLKITDRSFRYASPRLWNQLPDSFHQPRQLCLDSPPHSLVSSSLLSSPLSSSILHSFTPGSKPTFSTNPFHLRLLLPTGLPSWQRDWTGPIMLIGLFLVSHFNFLFVPCGGLSWLPVSFLLHVKYTLSYRIVVAGAYSWRL